jgi:hypothetical protein
MEQTKEDSKVKGAFLKAVKMEGISHHQKQQSCPEKVMFNMAGSGTNNL